jgi:ribonucleotide reductase alpha subunit
LVLRADLRDQSLWRDSIAALWRLRPWFAESPAFRDFALQAALQRFVDNSISKTVTVPDACSFDKFHDIFDDAYDLELKGCTVFRPYSLRGEVLTTTSGPNAAHCCDFDREVD